MASGAEMWLQHNAIDEGARRVFLSLDRDMQDTIRHMGTVWNCSNPSATLMKRIRDLAGYVPTLDNPSEDSHQEPSWKKRRSYLTHPTPPKEIVLFFRGEANRLGHNKEHGTDLPTDTFARNLNSFAEFLAAPLEEQGFKVLVFADLMGDPARLTEVEFQLRRAFGTAFLEARFEISFLASFGKYQYHQSISSNNLIKHHDQSIHHIINTKAGWK